MLKTIGVTEYLLKIIAENAKTSVILQLLLRFLLFIKKEYKSSKFYALVLCAVNSVKNDYETSFLKKIMKKRSRLQTAYESSMLCAVIYSAYVFISGIASKVFDFTAKHAKGGYIYGTVERLSEKSYCTYNNVFGLFIACMLVCPHEIWNNLYAVVAAFAFLGIYMIRSYKKLENSAIKNEGIGLVLFTIFVGISGIYACNKGDAIRIILFVYSSLVFSFIIRNSLNTEEKFLNMLKIISIGGFATSVIGIIQRLYGVEVNPEYVDVLANASMPGRVFSTFANPNNFAELLVLIMPASASLIILSKSKKEKNIWITFLVVDFVAIGMSYSRSSWIALAIAAVVMLLIYDWKLLIPCIVIFIVVLPLLPASITDRILTIGSMKDTSNASRFYIWEGSWKLVKEYFLSGVGAGPLTFKEYYLPVANPLMATSPHSHMLYMELIIEFGIVAFIGFMLYVFHLIKNAFLSLVGLSAERRAVIGALLGSVLGMLFVFLVEYVWFYPRDMFMFWIILGMLSVSCIIFKKNGISGKQQ